MKIPEAWFGWAQAFDDPVTGWITVGGAAVLFVAGVLIAFVIATRRVDEPVGRELRLRYLSWLVLGPLLVGPILLGPFWTIAGITLLSLMCIREFMRITGCFRERSIYAIVSLGTLLTFFAVLDHWYGLFVAVFPLTVAAIAIVGLLGDAPSGYIQRVALGVMAFTMFGAGLGHLAYFANHPNYRPILLMLILCTELNDVFAFCSGKLFGRRKLAVHTSPNKTWAGAIGAVLLTSPLVAGIAHVVFEGTPLDRWESLVLLGVMVSVLGQLGDLMLSAIKRDVGVKDTGILIPGHGGLLDRFDSLLLVSPATFHFVYYGVSAEFAHDLRVMTGSG